MVEYCAPRRCIALAILLFCGEAKEGESGIEVMRREGAVEWDRREKAAAGRGKKHLPLPTLDRGRDVAQARKRHTGCLFINQIDGMS